MPDSPPPAGDRPTDFEVKPGQYHDTPIPDARGGQLTTFARKRRILDVSKPDPQTPNITGRYQDESGVLSLQINQAGSHIECWLAELIASSPTTRRRFFRLGGDVLDAATYQVYHYPTSSQVSGQIRIVDKKLQVTLTLGSQTKTSVFELNEQRPTLSDAALDALPGKTPIAMLSERFPCSRQTLAVLVSELGGRGLGPRIQRYIDVGSGATLGAQIDRAKAARALDGHIADALSPNGRHKWNVEEIPLLEYHARQIIDIHQFAHAGVTRSLRQWLQIMMDTTMAEDFGKRNQMPSVARHLDLKPTSRKDVPPFLYRISLILNGLSGDVVIGVGGFVGAVVVEKFESTQPGAPMLWKASFPCWVGGISGGASVGFQLGLLTFGQAISHADYAPGDIPGWISFVDASAKGALGAGFGFGGTLMLIEGTGAHPKLAVDLTGFTGNAGVGGGAEIGMAFGRIHAIGHKFPDPNISTVGHKSDYAVEAELMAQIHYHLGDAIVTPLGRQALRVFCAAELCSLSSPGSRLTINGHADRVDTEERNNELSLLRAKNAYTAIRDILNGSFRLDDAHVHTLGLGERAAADAGDPDEKPNPRFRRVELLLNSRLVLTLQGA